MTRSCSATRGLVVLALMATSVTSAACGVPAEDEPRLVEQVAVDVPPTSPPASLGPSGGVEVTFCLTRGDELVAVTRPSTAVPDVRETVRDLLAGPTEAESSQGLGTALGGAPVVGDVRMEGATAVLTVRPDETETARNDDVLALGQVVCTLTARPDVTGVSFERDGEPVAVPRGDGSLTPEPLRASDFDVLRSTD